MKYALFALLALVVALASFISFRYFYDDKISEVEINGASVTAEIVDTPELRMQGLSGRDSLDKDKGMLFVFDEPGRYGFYMRDMNFAIDIIWMDEDFEVVDIVEDLRPDTYPEVFEPDRPALFVLEVVSGFVEENDILIGTQADISNL